MSALHVSAVPEGVKFEMWDGTTPIGEVILGKEHAAWIARCISECCKMEMQTPDGTILSHSGFHYRGKRLGDPA